MKYLLLFTTLIFAGELEVDGNLKVTGTVDANGNPITNVGTPLLSTDAASAGYVLNAAAGRGRIIVLKCPWWQLQMVGSCEPPPCPADWNELAQSNETSGIAINSGNNSYLTGNSIRYCMEQEEE